MLLKYCIDTYIIETSVGEIKRLCHQILVKCIRLEREQQTVVIFKRFTVREAGHVSEATKLVNYKCFLYDGQLE